MRVQPGNTFQPGKTDDSTGNTINPHIASTQTMCRTEAAERRIRRSATAVNASRITPLKAASARAGNTCVACALSS